MLVLSLEMSEEEVSKIRTQSACLLDFWSLLHEICLSDKALKNVALVDIMASRTVVPTGSDEKVIFYLHRNTVISPSKLIFTGIVWNRTFQHSCRENL